MSKANPLRGAPRIHGELLKLGMKISQATVGLIISKYFNGLFGRYNLTCFQFPTALTRIFICALESL